MTLTEVPVGVVGFERFREVVGSPDEITEIDEGTGRALGLLAGRCVWMVNSTAAGGGVAELLAALGPYVRGAGIDFRWIVIEGSPEFFEITKRIHNRLHGNAGDGGPLGDAEHELYERALAANASELSERIRSGDVVVLHDPQTAGLVAPLREAGAKVLWRCHVGSDEPDALARDAWDFLYRYVEDADGFIFSRRAYIWDRLDPDRAWVVHPSIDVFSAKNQELGPDVVEAILARIGLGTDGGTVPAFSRRDGSPGRVERVVEIDQAEPLGPEVPMVTQVSRWDRLKDHAGVLEAFATHVRNEQAHLVLLGPAVEGVTDDPEGAQVLGEIRDARSSLPVKLRNRVHLVSLPTEDSEENAAMVNAVQRRSTIVVQKSLAEGFGLTVGEAMWKGRPVISSRVGGLQEQIVDGESGLLLDDPRDLESFAAMIDRVLDDPGLATRLGEAARERVRDAFLGPRHLLRYVEIVGAVLGADQDPG